MNRLASFNQRTGQPRCVQVMAKAINSSSLSRRNQAAVLAVTPAQGSGEASSKTTEDVSPILNPSTLPTERHTAGGFRNNGAKMKPINGTLSIKVPIPPAARLKRARNFRLESSAGESGQPVDAGSVFGSFMTNVSDPSRQRHGKQHDADAGDYQCSNQSPHQEGDSQRQGHGPYTRLRQFFRWQDTPSPIRSRRDRL